MRLKVPMRHDRSSQGGGRRRPLRRAAPAGLAVAMIVAAFAQAADAPATLEGRAAGGDHHIAGLWENRSGVLFNTETPPLKGEFLKAYTEYQEAQRKSLKALGDRLATCLPSGAPRVMFAPFPIEIIESRGQVTIIQESMSQTRRIFIDGRPHPADLEPTWNGHSIGKWDGDTLVVDTVGIRDDTVLDSRNVPHSDAMHLVERIHRSAPDTLDYEYTVDDPKAFNRPFSGRKTYRYRPDWQVLDWICENNRESINEAGETVQRLK